MRIGVPKEIKQDEYRVAMTPAGVREFTDAGHEVIIETSAGIGAGLTDEQYREQGAKIVNTPEEVFDQGEMIVHVKELQANEIKLLKPEHLLFTYLHLAPDPEQTTGLIESGATCIAYETVEDGQGGLPLLAPMSAIAGRLATQAGAYMLHKPNGGRGVLLGGVPGVAAATVLVIGGGVVGTNAAVIAMGMLADVYIFDRYVPRLKQLDEEYAREASTVYSSTLAIEEMLPRADLVIGAVLVHGAKAPFVVRKDQLKLMKPGAVLVDVAIDQGGCFETSRPTTHRDPTFEVDGITHYCVANMPGAAPVTATHALTNATLPYALALANDGLEACVNRDPGLRPGVNVANGHVTHQAVAEGVGREYVPLEEALGWS